MATCAAPFAWLIGSPITPGLTEYLAGNASIVEVMQRPLAGSGRHPGPAGSGLVNLYPCREKHDKAADLSGNRRFERLISTTSRPTSTGSSSIPLRSTSCPTRSISRAPAMLCLPGRARRCPQVRGCAACARRAQGLKGPRLCAQCRQGIRPSGGYYGYDGYDKIEA